MKILGEDTSPEAEEVYFKLLRKATPQQKLTMMINATNAARALVMAGMRHRHPTESDEILRRRFADIWLGPDLALKAYWPLEQ